MIPTKPADATWTDEQWQAIWAKGQDMLVSAAAGSGKTAVLINRMIEKVLAEQEPISVDELLVVTFTNASAAEMRHRMSKALEQAVVDNPGSKHLRKQLRLINKAQISTLHSFCLQVVKQYAYLLEIDPGFRIANDTEAALLRDDVLEAVLEAAYEGEDAEAVYRLADSFTTDRSDQAMEVLLSKLYDYSRVHPQPEKWLEQVPALYDVPEGAIIDELPFIDDLKMTVRHALEQALHLTQEGKDISLSVDGPEALSVTFDLDADLIGAAHGALEESWENLYRMVQQFKWPKAASVRRDSCDPELAEEAKGLRNEVKKIVNGVFESYFIRSPKRLLEEMREMAPLMKTLTDLTKVFAQQYKALKIERALVDFSDLEHYALEILSDDGKPSAIAEEYQNRFKEVLVDEYQDTNMLQESILSLVKSGGERDGNLFMVGDVKQSIYRFRLAEPMLFLGKYSRFTKDAEASGLKIDLNANFRSRKEVLDGTNYIFSQIMGSRVGEIDYDEAAALKAQAPYPEQEVPVELALIHEPETEEAPEEDLAKSQWEARFIAGKIRELMDQETLVHDPWTKQQRLLKYSDIVILMRSMTWSGDFVDEFKGAGVPLYAELSGGYFDALEVMIMMNTLRVIDNPYQDVPLVSVLRAPFIGLKENELAEIRLAAPQASYYEAVKSFIRGGTGIDPAAAEKLRRFILQLEDWRNQARRGSLAELIWQVYLDTNYYEMAGAMSNGKQRQANLRALHDRALEYEKTSFRGLFRFLRFIDRMRERGDDLGTAKSLSEKEDVVRLMTVHKSKGLEFPIVFFAGTGRPFNEMDFKKSYLFDQDYGLAVKAVNPDTRIEYTSLPFLAVKEMKQLQMKAEEMRVLYVAMTRAKERLFLTASVKEIDKLFGKWKVASTRTLLPDYVRSRAKGYLDWIGPALSRHPDAADAFQTGGNVMPHSSRFHIEIIEAANLTPLPIDIDELLKTETGQEDYRKEVEQRFDFAYPYQHAVEKRSKQSVSEMKRLQMLQRLEEPESFIQATENLAPTKRSLVPRPAFMQDKQLSAADVGTAVHAVMQHIPLDKRMAAPEIKELIETLVGMEILSPDEGEAVKVKEIENFFSGELSLRLANAKSIKREVPFTYAKQDSEGDYQIIQGIVDCLFEEEDGWVLLDYKTDRVYGIPDLQKEMASRYEVQLSVYQEAVEAILQIPIKERVLYLFAAGQQVEI